MRVALTVTIFNPRRETVSRTRSRPIDKLSVANERKKICSTRRNLMTADRWPGKRDRANWIPLPVDEPKKPVAGKTTVRRRKRQSGPTGRLSRESKLRDVRRDDSTGTSNGEGGRNKSSASNRGRASARFYSRTLNSIAIGFPAAGPLSRGFLLPLNHPIFELPSFPLSPPRTIPVFILHPTVYPYIIGRLLVRENLIDSDTIKHPRDATDQFSLDPLSRTVDMYSSGQGNCTTAFNREITLSEVCIVSRFQQVILYSNVQRFNVHVMFAIISV